MPLVSREHTGIDHGGKKNRRSDCNRASSPLSVLLLWRLHNIHNPHIVGPPAITNRRGAAAPTPARPRDGHSRFWRPNGRVCPYKFSGGAMKAAAQRSGNHIPHIPPESWQPSRWQTASLWLLLMQISASTFVCQVCLWCTSERVRQAENVTKTFNLKQKLKTFMTWNWRQISQQRGKVGTVSGYFTRDFCIFSKRSFWISRFGWNVL